MPQECLRSCTKSVDDPIEERTLPLHILMFSCLDTGSSSVLSLYVLGHTPFISSYPTDHSGWTGSLYWCDYRHGYPYVVRALMSLWSTIGDMHPEDGSELWSQYVPPVKRRGVQTTVRIQRRDDGDIHELSGSPCL